MRIATFNVNSIRMRLPVVQDWLETNRPDIICLQETKVQDPEFPAAEFLDKGYYAAYSGEKGYNGVAILSLIKPDSIGYGFEDQPYDKARLISASFGQLQIVNTYVPQGRDTAHPMFQYKIEWFKRLKNYFSTHYSKTDLLAWTGDLNVAPEFIDIHNAEMQENHVCFHKDARAAFKLTCEWGFSDVFRMHNQEPGHYTFFDYRNKQAVKRNQGWRIDMILCTESLAARCTGSHIDIKSRMAPKPSDHAVLAADFDL